MDLTSKPEDRAQRLGSTLARLWRAFRNLEFRFGGWLASMGCPSLCITATRWALRAGVIVLAFYQFAYVAVGLVALLLVGSFGGKAILLPEPPKEDEWRMGWAGFGMYDANDCRIDPHDPDRAFNQP